MGKKKNKLAIEEQSILQIKKVDNLNRQFVTIDPISFSIIEISRVQSSSSNGIVIEFISNDIIDQIFNGLLSISDISVQFDDKLDRFTLSKRNKQKTGIHLLDIRMGDSLIYITYTQRKITFNINYTKLASMLSNHCESVIKKSITLFISEKDNFNYVYGQYKLNLYDLIERGSMDFYVNWIKPKWKNLIDNVSIITNCDISIGFSEPENKTTSLYRPQILYKLTNSNLMLKSLMVNVDNYIVRDKLILSLMNNDSIIQTIEMNSKEFNNCNIVILDDIDDSITSIKTDHIHLNIQNDANTYYRI